MIDFISFWKQQAEKWDDENFCNNCWSFGYPQTHDRLNSQQIKEGKECCVQILVTDLRWSTTPRYNFKTGLRMSANQITNMTVHFLKPGEMGRDNYNETLGHPFEEGKWEQTIKPLVECLNQDAALDWCVILGHRTELVTWNVRIRQNWLDQNYDGLTIDMSFRSTLF